MHGRQCSVFFLTAAFAFKRRRRSCCGPGGCPTCVLGAFSSTPPPPPPLRHYLLPSCPHPHPCLYPMPASIFNLFIHSLFRFYSSWFAPHATPPPDGYMVRGVPVFLPLSRLPATTVAVPNALSLGFHMCDDWATCQCLCCLLPYPHPIHAGSSPTC